MSIDARFAGLVVLLLFLAPAGFADEAEESHFEELERRIEELEAAADPAASAATAGASWARYVRLGGSANAGFFGGGEGSPFATDAFQIRDARFFVDAYLGDAVRISDQTIFRNVGLTFEWDLVRLGDLDNRVGELYVDFQGVFEQDCLNFQVGRFQLPVGESYLRYSQGYADKPFVSNTVGGPWWWDEGVRFYGSSADGRLGYVAAVSDGDTSFNTDTTEDKLVSLKLYTRPTSWFYVSASGVRGGEAGNSSSPASGALWLGEAWGRAFGSRSDVDNYQDGGIVPDAPNRIDDSWFVGVDTVFDFEDKVRIWLAGGRFALDSPGGGYDRVLYYWIAEAVFRGAWVSPDLRPFYLGVRANALATYDDDHGYLLDSARSDDLGYNMESLTDYSVVLGWELNDYVTVRLEYTHRDVGVVRGVSSEIRGAARDPDFYALEVGGSF